MQIPPIYKEALTPETAAQITDPAEQLMATVLFSIPEVTFVYHEPHMIILAKAERPPAQYDPELRGSTRRKKKKKIQTKTLPDLLAVVEPKKPDRSTFYFYFEVTKGTEISLRRHKKGQRSVMQQARLENATYMQLTLRQIETLKNDEQAFAEFAAMFEQVRQ